MTRKETISVIELIIKRYMTLNRDEREALEKAIEALSQPEMDEIIEAIDNCIEDLKEVNDWGRVYGMAIARDIIKEKMEGEE